MAVQSICQVVSNAPLGAHLFSMTLAAPEIAACAMAGQFLHLSCGEGNLLRRPISICAVEGERIRIVFEVKGDGTRWLSTRKAGDSVDVLGPLGRGFDLPALGKTPVLLGGGIGVPPMLQTARALAKTGASVTVITGARTRELCVLAEELSAFDHIACTDDGSLGVHGFVTDVLKEKLAGASGVAACGPKPMLRAIAALCADADVPCQVSMEERMGCGIGACLVCACALRAQNGETSFGHVCKDGPVFDAREVQW